MGALVRIWGDKWLPRTSDHKVFKSQTFLDSDAEAETLIDRNGQAWKVDLVQKIFSKHRPRKFSIFLLGLLGFRCYVLASYFRW